MKKNLNSTLLVAPLLLLLLSGCAKHEEAPAPPSPKKAPQAQVAGTPAAAVQKPISSAIMAQSPLDFQKKNDPFKPYLSVAVATIKKEQPQAARPGTDLLPIQSFEVGKFKVAGIIAGLKENRALLIDPNGKGFVVQEGMQIGNNNGRISRITATSVEVIEKFKASSGRIRQTKIILTLAKKR